MRLNASALNGCFRRLLATEVREYINAASERTVGGLAAYEVAQAAEEELAGEGAAERDGAAGMRSERAPECREACQLQRNLRQQKIEETESNECKGSAAAPTPRLLACVLATSSRSHLTAASMLMGRLPGDT